MATMDQIFTGYRDRMNDLEATYDKSPFARGVAWIEGDLVPIDKARIPLLDQGFMHSDLTYDVPSLPLPEEEVKKILIEMVAKSGIRDAFVQLIVTRGLKSVRGAVPCEVLRNNLYMFVQPFVWVMEPEMQLTGGKAVVARTVKRTPSDCFDPTIKNLQWGDLTRGMFEAADRGAMYPFLTDGDGNLTEGSGFNIGLVKDGVLYTPDRGVLPGITRKSVVDVAKSLNLEVRVEDVPTEMAYNCDEIFMCTTAGGIMPITELDGKPVKNGNIGAITKQIWDGYWALHYDPAYTFEIDYATGAA
ncbi:Aminotransferase, class IV [Penicillium occitanis (nom. inval.)]|nr:hypothetical protein PENOC_090890 [Penicillium occitanis (nom. inval.)]PCH03624.1 Aminotransferase, class IV [Penicillium occitanis (nom. inval.)]